MLIRLPWVVTSLVYVILSAWFGAMLSNLFDSIADHQSLYYVSRVVGLLGFGLITIIAGVVLTSPSNASDPYQAAWHLSCHWGAGLLAFVWGLGGKAVVEDIWLLSWNWTPQFWWHLWLASAGLICLFNLAKEDKN